MASSFRPASVTLESLRLSSIKIFENGQFLQARVRHLGAFEVQRLQSLESGQFLQACVRQLGIGEVQTIEIFKIGKLL